MKTLYRFGAMLIIALVFAAASVSAQDDSDFAGGDLPEPDPHMQDLSWFIGEWDVHSRMLMNADTGEWLEEDLRTEHTHELGGNLIFEHFGGPLGGEPFEAWSLRKYNVNSGNWEQRWVDVAPGGFANWLGRWDMETSTFTGYAMRFIDTDFNLTGQDGAREVFDNITEEGFDWRYEQTSDGGQTWNVTWTLEYRRAQGE
ncbi:MAG: DUF1579 family protein [Chloroflexi bacterium]|nr:DUF1579 family protein [Chloroflexota bacterium]